VLLLEDSFKETKFILGDERVKISS